MHRCPSLRKRVLAVERDRRIERSVSLPVDLDTAVVNKAQEALPARERVADASASFVC
jgi:hypothetical protein